MQSTHEFRYKVLGVKTRHEPVEVKLATFSAAQKCKHMLERNGWTARIMVKMEESNATR